MTDHVRVCFALTRNADGWPPVTFERMWAMPTGTDNVVVLDNIPVFAHGVSCNDVVSVAEDDDGVLWAREQIRWSGNCTIRVVPTANGPLLGDRRAVLDTFAPFGVDGEGSPRYGLVALNVPADADLAAVKRLLRAGEDDLRWIYEEGCVGDAWVAA